MIRASAAQVAVDDRGFNYGDGVFETMLVVDGEPVWWEAHYARLRRGCEVLGIACPRSEELLAQACAFVGIDRGGPAESSLGPSASAGRERFDPPVRVTDSRATRDAERETSAGSGTSVALKLVLTRGAGGRGYAPPREATPTIVWSLHEAPAPQRDGIAVRWCELRLSQQPVLAGLKHLNRLENVLARAEWNDPAIAEGLLLDADGRVVGATAANLFALRNGELLTPSLQRCGVAGTARAWVMAHMPVVEADLTRQDIETADELFLTSSLRGILPVARLGGREWTVGPMTRRLQGLLHDEVPAL